MDYANHYSIPGAVLSLDIQKTFDSVDWVFIRKVLEVFGFGQKIIIWIGILYTNVSCCITNNNFLSEFFYNKRRKARRLFVSNIICFSNTNSSNLIKTNSSGRGSHRRSGIKISLFTDDIL